MKISITIAITVLIVIVFNSSTYSKIDTTYQKPSIKDTTKTHPGKKAAILSAILPGLGQASNKKYWKIPIIYALGATTLYYVDYHHSRYILYRDAFLCLTVDTTCEFTLDQSLLNQVKILKDEHRRNRDWFIILSCAVYALNIIDASVDAHLLDFDITDDLSLSIQPGIFQNYYSGISGGLSLKLSF
ncbi:MAG: hypothetical protein FVQ77_15940 [Cytophagales bacterium]|nr:hypothetical protein [Cytophagales bacterium]